MMDGVCWRVGACSSRRLARAAAATWRSATGACAALLDRPPGPSPCLEDHHSNEHHHTRHWALSKKRFARAPLFFLFDPSPLAWGEAARSPTPATRNRNNQKQRATMNPSGGSLKLPRLRTKGELIKVRRRWTRGLGARARKDEEGANGGPSPLRRPFAAAKKNHRKTPKK
jgi:hypothetical protein